MAVPPIASGARAGRRARSKRQGPRPEALSTPSMCYARSNQKGSRECQRVAHTMLSDKSISSRAGSQWPSLPGGGLASNHNPRQSEPSCWTIVHMCYMKNTLT